MIFIQNRVIVFLVLGGFLISGCTSPDPSGKIEPEIVRRKIYEKKDVSVISFPIKEPIQEAAVSKPETTAPRKEDGRAEKVLPATYRVEGGVDPFEPIIKDESALKHGKLKTSRRTPSTPLEMIDLSQIKLTAVIKMPTGAHKAMLEESSGKGYFVGLGTYVGLNSGKIINILKDRVVVEEEIEDLLGNISIRNSEIAFQRP